MAKRNVTARAERIVRLLPRILGSLTHWHNDRTIMGMTESARIDRTVSSVKIPQLKNIPLTFNQYQALSAILELDQCSVNELSEKLGIAQSTTSQLVDRLFKGGYVSRDVSPGDRRKMVVSLSRAGMQMMERRKQSLLKSYSRVLQLLEEGDQVMLEEAFEQIYRVASTLNRLQTK